jgi:hypothetical protein
MRFPPKATPRHRAESGPLLSLERKKAHSGAVGFFLWNEFRAYGTVSWTVWVLESDPAAAVMVML